MTRNEILEKTVKIVCDCLPELADRGLTEATVINTDTGVDSMGFTLIICRIEAAFDIKIPDRRWRRLQTLGDVVTEIEKRI